MWKSLNDSDNNARTSKTNEHCSTYWYPHCGAILLALPRVAFSFWRRVLFWLKDHMRWTSFLAGWLVSTPLHYSLTKEAHNKILFGMDFSVFGMDFCRFWTGYFCYYHVCTPRTQASLKGVDSIMLCSFSRYYIFNVSYEGVFREGASVIFFSETVLVTEGYTDTLDLK